MTKPLTNLRLQSIKPGAKRQEIPDAPELGFKGRLRFVVQPSGAKSWAVRYRHEGKPRKLTIGPYPKVGLQEARKRTRAALTKIAEGRDPAAEEKASKATAAMPSADRETVAAVVEEFIKRHVREKSKESSAGETERMLRKEIAAPWGARPFKQLTKRDVIELLDAIQDRGSPYTANRVFGLLRTMCKWAKGRGIIDASPCADMTAPCVEIERDRILTDDEIRIFWRAAKRTAYPFGPLLQLLLLTGQRRDEVAGMRRSEVDLATGTWTLPKSRTKNQREHVVSLPAAALDILRAVPSIPATKDRLFSTTGTTSVSGYSKAKARLDKRMLRTLRALARVRGEDPTGVTLVDWRLHDLRRTAASGMARLGMPVHVVEALLNHKSGSIRGVVAIYNRYDYAAEKRSALAAWARYLENLTTGQPASNVVALRA